MEKYYTVNHCIALGEEVEKLTSAFKAVMFPQHFGAEEPIAPELLAAFAECAECCRDFADLYDYFTNKPTPEEEAANWEADYFLATGSYSTDDLDY